MSAEAEPVGSGPGGRSRSVRASFTGRTAWARNLAAPIRDFLSAETGGAVVLLVAAVAALVWANSPWSDSYESLWRTKLSIHLGGAGISLDLQRRFNELVTKRQMETITPAELTELIQITDTIEQQDAHLARRRGQRIQHVVEPHRLDRNIGFPLRIDVDRKQSHACA